MCGVAGIYAYHYAANPIRREELLRIRDHMRSRGPDASGCWISRDERVGLGHRRLSVIDLSAAANQPMRSGDGKLVISFNGEIYNYRALRRELERQGCRFTTESDTEVLLQLYRARGTEMFHALRGMYAFALWDEDRASLLLARDPYGIKPLYYADDGWTVRIASQVKALLAGGAVSRDREPAGVVGFYLLGSVPEPYTLYREIRAVPAGGYVWVSSTGPQRPVNHFSIARVWAAAQRSDEGELPNEQTLELIRGALVDSVRHHLVADVPVGVFLSSGIDSGALVGLMRDAGQQTSNIKTITVTFDEFQGKAEDESPLSVETARTYGTEHHVRRVSRAEFLGDLPWLMEAMDQPTVDGINTWFVAKAAAEQGLKVALSGLGGDELFGGYPSFRDIPRWVWSLWLPSRIPGAAAALRFLLTWLFPRANPKMRGLLEFGGSYAGAWYLKRAIFLPRDLPAILDRDVVREGLRRLRLHAHLSSCIETDPGTSFGRVAALEASLYLRNQLLRDTDWASMAHSVEARVPYVDPTLLGVIARFARVQRPYKDALISSPRIPLPDAVIHRAKTGFTTPIPQWLQEHETLNLWRHVPELREATCPWARRWSHVVAERFAFAA